tara:strand:+ start:519 stop:1052 length:534 start_codon:yes stop_codon:yes gene_type:complete
MANKLTRLKVEVDTGMKDFVPKSYITEKDFKDFKGKSKIKPSITIRRQKFEDKFMSGSPSQEVESEFGIKFSKDQKGVFFRKRFKRGGDVMPARNKKNFRPTEKGAGMTQAGVAAYRRANPGSKLKTAVTGKVKPGSKAAKRRKSFCARSAGQMKKFPKAAKDPNSRLRQARRRWKC